MAEKTCSPVWQYILTMLESIQASATAMKYNGQFHTDAELTPIAVRLDALEVEVRECGEDLTGWVPPKNSTK